MEYKDEYIRRLNKALRFIEKNYSENILLDDIAASASFSSYHFHRIFLSILGETPSEYLRRIRLEKAAVLLQLHPDYSINQIVHETGFSSSAVFSRAFQNRFSLSPRDYRKNIHNLKTNILLSDDTKLPNPSTIKPVQSPKQYELQEIRHLPTMYLAYVRSMNGYGSMIEKAWKTLFAWAYSNDIIDKHTKVYGIPLDDPDITPINKCRYFAALTVDKTIKLDSPVELMVLQKGKYAVFNYVGKLLGISSFYKFLYGTWLPESGYLPDDHPSLEEYPIKNSIAIDPVDKEKIFNFSMLLPIRPL